MTRVGELSFKYKEGKVVQTTVEEYRDGRNKDGRKNRGTV